ncbi:hypothetical protein BAMBUS_05680 [Brevundimonas phage vB_BpoS-Bambus]|nr:hypothetical protein BAMBUS_05680 [Brevundimonas phage vB_BpoS-Bambus]
MTTQAERIALAAAAALPGLLADAAPAPHEGPAFEGSSNCLANIERDYARRRRGHWFDKNAMKGFGTKFPGGFYDFEDLGVTLFVTTEQPPHGPRVGTIRAYVWKSADVVNVTPFGVGSPHVVNKAMDRLWSLLRQPVAA